MENDMKKLLAKIKGIGLLELMLSLAIIAILLVMATRYYSVATNAQRTDDTVQLIGELETGVNAMSAAGLANSDITLQKLIDNGYITKQRIKSSGGTSSIISPWGGGAVTYTAPASGSTANITVAFSNVPKDKCQDLETKYYANVTKPTGAGCAVDTLVFTYVFQ